MNKVFLIGNLTKDPHAGLSSNGKPYSMFTIAINNNYNGTKTTDYIGCSAWGNSANFLNSYLKKGDKVLVEGRLYSMNTTDEVTGKPITRLSVTADNVQSLSSPRNENNNNNYAQSSPMFDKIVNSGPNPFNTDSAFSKNQYNSSTQSASTTDEDEWMDELDANN